MPVNVEGFKKGDRTNIEIPKVQQEMVKALKATGKPVVYVLCTGSALALNWEDANIDAILNAWYGGQEAGTAVGVCCTTFLKEEYFLEQLALNY